MVLDADAKMQHVYYYSYSYQYCSYAKLTIATVEVWVGAGSAVLWSQVDLGVKVLRHGGIALLAGSLLGV